MTIAQVQVDDAYWTFTQDPPGQLRRLATAWIHVPFPWVLGEAHEGQGPDEDGGDLRS